jgi:hypothetical protein
LVASFDIRQCSQRGLKLGQQVGWIPGALH